MKHLLKKAKAITILILMLSLIGCENDDNNLPKVIAGFTYTLNADTGTVTFINTSENAGSYTWDFGDGGTSKEINPIKTYANGTYTVVLKAFNASGASATPASMKTPTSSARETGPSMKISRCRTTTPITRTTASCKPISKVTPNISG